MYKDLLSYFVRNNPSTVTIYSFYHGRSHCGIYSHALFDFAKRKRKGEVYISFNKVLSFASLQFVFSVDELTRMGQNAWCLTMFFAASIGL